MQVGRRGVAGSDGRPGFARFEKRSFSIIPHAVVEELVARRVGRNGWAVMAALCQTIFEDGGLGRLSSRQMRAITGVSAYQVARGMTELRDDGVIVPVVVRNEQGYRHPDRSNHGHVARYCIAKPLWERVLVDGARSEDDADL